MFWCSFPRVGISIDRLREFHYNVGTVRGQLNAFLTAEIGVEAAVDEHANVVRSATPFEKS